MGKKAAEVVSEEVSRGMRSSRAEPTARTFKRPGPPQTMDTGDRLFDWFAGRGISREIVEAMGIYTTGVAYWKR